MPKLRRQNYWHNPQKRNADNIPLRLRWNPGLAGSRRNPGREDGFQWNADHFLSPADVDGNPNEAVSDCEIDILQQIIEDISTGDEYEPQRMSVSLLDIARPAKAKGVAKDFEIIETPIRVVALEEEEAEWPDVDEDEWESIYAVETQHMQQRTYSEVLRGKNTH